MLESEERELTFGGSVSDEFWSLDVAKCQKFAKIIEIWRREARERPEDARIAFEDEDHIFFKIRQKSVNLPKPRKRRELSEAEREALGERLRGSLARKKGSGTAGEA